MPSDSKPLVSICMPAHKSGKFIRLSIESLLAQDYENFEFIISDNASDDGTEEICLQYQSIDPRIRYHRNKRNLGISRNLNQLIEWASGKYFMYAESHNLWHPSYVSRCVDVLEKNFKAVLCHARTMLIDSEGNPLRVTPKQMDTRDMTPAQRYLHVISTIRGQSCDMQSGVIRAEVMKSLRGFKQILGCDNAVLAELALKGEAIQIDEPMYFSRGTREDAEAKDREARYWRIVGPKYPAKSKLRHARLYRELALEHLLIVLTSPSLSYREKIALVPETIYCFASRVGVFGSLIAPPVRFFRPQLRRLLQKSQPDLKLGDLR